MGFAEALRDGLAAKGLSLHQLSAACAELGTPVTASALSYWLAGRTRPRRKASLAVVRSIEHILDAPSGTLTSLLDEVPPTTETDASVPAPLRRHVGTAQALRSSWGLPADDGLQHHLCMDSATITDEEIRIRTRIMMSATRNGADRFLYLRSREEGRGAPVHGATLGRCAEMDGHTIHEILLPRPLAMSEMAVVEFEHSGPVEDAVPRLRLSTVRFTDVLALNLDFRGTRRPLTVDANTDVVDTAGHRITVTEELPVRGARTQLTAWRVTAGSLELRWRR